MKRFSVLRPRVTLRSLGPVAAVPLRDALKSSLGAGIAIALAVGLSLLSEGHVLHFALIAPFGASAVLVFGAVSSPLAQPWPVLVGNTASAAAALLLCHLLPVTPLVLPLSVAAALLVMALLRATHPPGGAAAMTVALMTTEGALPGPLFPLFPVASGSLLLILAAALWARLSGRRYPMRQFGEPGPNRTADIAAVSRLGLGEEDLRRILDDYRQSLNLGVEDLARLIGAAELRAASQSGEIRHAGDIMSRDLVTVGPEASLEEIAGIFRRHRFTSLPVVAPGGRLLGVFFQLHVLTALAAAGRPTLVPGFRRRPALRAADVMNPAPATADEATPLGDLVALLSAAGTDAVMITEGAQLTGVITQTDLIAALVRKISRQPVRD